MVLFKKHILVFLPLLLFPVFMQAQAVFKTPSDFKYHLSSCKMVKNVSKELSVANAEMEGLQPCKICLPQSITTNKLVTQHKAKGQSETTQCSGLTKAGTRCRHMTSIANGLCYQHQK